MTLFRRHDNDPDPPDFETLRRRCIEGSETARRTFVRRLEPLVWQTILARFGNLPREDQEEIVADTFIALLADNARLLARYSPTRGLSLPGYVRRQAILQGYNRYRKLSATKRRSETHLDLDDHATHHAVANARPTPEDQTATKEHLEQVLERLRRHLSPALLITFELLYVRELPPPKAAAVLGCSMDVIYQRKKRLIRAADALLKQDPAGRGT